MVLSMMERTSGVMAGMEGEPGAESALEDCR